MSSGKDANALTMGRRGSSSEETTATNDVKDCMEQSKVFGQRLESLLGCGRFQYFQIGIFTALLALLGATGAFQLAFTIADGKHRCSLPPQIEQNFKFEDFDNTTEIVKSCKVAKFVGNEDCYSYRSTHELLQCFNTSEMVSCKEAHGYVHQREYDGAFWSLKSEKEWLCEDEYLASNVMSAMTVGMVINTAILMQFADRYGRKPLVYLTVLVQLTCRLMAVFIVDSYYLLLIVIALGSSFTPFGFRVGVTLVAEYCDSRGRYLNFMSDWIWWVTGVAMLPVVAWLCQTWYVYGLIVPLVGLFLLPLFWFTPESPRLLLTQGKVDQAEVIMRRINVWNNKPVPKNFSEELKDISSVLSQKTDLSCGSIIKSKRLTAYIVLLGIAWIVNDFLYAAGQLNSGNLAGNQFVNFSLVALTELPSCFVGSFLINRLGRRWSHVLCNMLNVIPNLIIVLLYLMSDDVGNIGSSVTVLAIASRLASNVAWYVMWVQVIEIIPTNVRGTGSNICGLIAAVPCIFVPHLTALGDTQPQLMYGIFTMIGLVGALATSFLPESYQQPLPECIEDTDNAKLNPYFSFRVWNNFDNKQKINNETV